MAFTENLNFCMEERGYSAYRLAIILGVNNQSVLNWQRGDNIPHTKTRIKIAEHFGITLAELDGDELPVLPEKNTAVPQDDGSVRIDFASRRIKCAHPVSILAAQYSVPTFKMQEIVGCDFNRAEGLCVGIYQPTPDEVQRIAAFFCISADELSQGWVPLSANPDVLFCIAPHK